MHGPYRRCHQAVPAHAEGADLPAHRRDRRRRHHLAARTDRRSPQLGLPLLLAAGLHLHPAGPDLRRIPRRGQSLARMAAARRRRRPGRPADHVRPGRHPAPPRGRAALAGRVRELPPRPHRQRRLRPTPTRRLGRDPRRAGAGPQRRHARRHDDAWDLQVALMEHLEGTWDQPDNGLWEMRGARRHFTHSKVMAWVAADRMATAVRTHPGLHGPADGGRRCATPSTPTSWPTATTPTATPSPSPTTRRASMPACS